MININITYKLGAAFVFVVLIMFTSFSVWALPSHSKLPSEISVTAPITAQIIKTSTLASDFTRLENAQPINVVPGTPQTTGTEQSYADSSGHEISVDAAIAQTTGAPKCSAMPTEGTSYLRNLCGSNCLTRCVSPL